MLRIAEHWHASDLGRQRQGNEDNYFVRAPLFVVADGMGGAQAGEVASEMAVESFDDGLPDGVAAPRRSSRVIEERQPAHPRRARAPTSRARRHGHDGDRRLRRRGRGRRSPTSATRAPTCCATASSIRLTDDHSLVGELVRARQADRGAGRDAPAALGDHPRARARGRTCRSTSTSSRPRAGDVFLLCSDGLTSMVHEPKLKPLLLERRRLARAGSAAS